MSDVVQKTKFTNEKTPKKVEVPNVIAQPFTRKPTKVKAKTVKLTFTNGEGEREVVELNGNKVGHRIEPLAFPVVTIWANSSEAGGDKTLVFINPKDARIEIAS